MFFSGIKDYLAAVQKVLAKGETRAWLKSVVIRSFVVAVIFFLLLSVLGAWGIATAGASMWFDFGAFLYVIALVYFSGSLLGLLMAMGLPFLVQEQKLARAITQNKNLKASKAGLKAHASELFSSFVSVVVSILAWPFILFPLLAPLGVLIMAWAYARESKSTCSRINLEYPEDLRLLNPKPSSAYYFGLGLIPSVLSLIPFVALVVWPTLLLASLAPQKRLEPDG